jgi:hypothetical protein
MTHAQLACEVRADRDPSLRLKYGYARDDAGVQTKAADEASAPHKQKPMRRCGRRACAELAEGADTPVLVS